MLDQPGFALREAAAWRALVRDHGWATLVTARPAGGLVVSRLPVIVDEESEQFAVLGHLARTDATNHQLGDHNVVLIVQGPHGYLSPWYRDGPHVPTWDFVVVHAFGRPTVLAPAETFRVLDATVDHLESRMPQPWRLAELSDYSHRIAGGTTGFPLDPVGVVGKAKLQGRRPGLTRDQAAQVTRLKRENAKLRRAMRSWRTHVRNVSADPIPSLPETAQIAAHLGSYSGLTSATIRTARSRNSSGYLLGRPMIQILPKECSLRTRREVPPCRSTLVTGRGGVARRHTCQRVRGS